MGSLPFIRPNAFYVTPVVRGEHGRRILIATACERKPSCPIEGAT
jgi:hypothetical protein